MSHAVHEVRLDYHALAPRATKALASLSLAAGSSLGARLKELVQLRISQINGCAFCMDMHADALTRQGVDVRALHTLAGWREAHRFFDARDRAALQWAEAVNAVPHRVPSDEDFALVRQHFSEAEIADLTYVVGAIRAWNMLNASFGMQVPEVPYAGG